MNRAGIVFASVVVYNCSQEEYFCKVNFLPMVVDNMSKTLFRSDFPIQCRYDHYFKYSTVLASFPLTRHFVLTIPRSRTMKGITIVHHLIKFLSFSITYLDWQTDGKYVVFFNSNFGGFSMSFHCFHHCSNHHVTYICISL